MHGVVFFGLRDAPGPSAPPTRCVPVQVFESLDVILLAALVLLVLARKLNVPYPTLLAVAGIAFAALPFAPKITVEPHLALRCSSHLRCSTRRTTPARARCGDTGSHC